MNYLIHATPVHLSPCLQYFILLFTIATITVFTLLLLLFYYYHHYKTVVNDKPLWASLFLGAAELTTHLLRLINILWLSVCRINKFGFYFPRRLLRSPILVGQQDYFLAPLLGSIALFVSSLGIHIVHCNPFIMGKPRDGKDPILPSTTRRGTTLNTFVALIHHLLWVSCLHHCMHMVLLLLSLKMLLIVLMMLLLCLMRVVC
jgi:hypothetical protein